jgi:hypothetical protein
MRPGENHGDADLVNLLRIPAAGDPRLGGKHSHRRLRHRLSKYRLRPHRSEVNSYDRRSSTSDSGAKRKKKGRRTLSDGLDELVANQGLEPRTKGL